MNEHETLESELRSLRPAPPPGAFLARLKAAKPAEPALETARAVRPTPESRAPGGASVADLWRIVLRWAVPAAVCVALGAVLWREALPPSAPSAAPEQTAVAAAEPELRADDVRIGRELVTSFDAVGRLPGGEPVRFRCQEWKDEVIWRDTARGVTVKRQSPRLEVVPVRFETY